MGETSARPVVPSPAEPVPAEFDLLCEQCGYSLIGLVDSNRCPECGKEFNPNELPLARVPWLYRIRLGWWKAYWDTVWLIMRAPAVFARDLCCPVRICAPDAKLFRNVTGWIAAGSIFLLGLMSATVLLYRGTRSGLAAVALTFGLLLGIRVFVHFATDMPTFIWRGPDARKPHELSPLQHYASAPVSLLIVPVGLLVFLLVLGELSITVPIRLTAALLGLALVSAAFLFVEFLWISVMFMRVATGCSARRLLAMASYLPIHWLLLGIISWIVTMLGTLLIVGILAVLLGV